jgi:septum formation protein
MLVLASASPRRQELLRNARIAFTAQPADVPEVRRDGEDPTVFAKRLAREKALAVYRRVNPGADQGTFVLGADTIVVVDGQVLGKPTDEQDAARMLRMLSGRTHEVITGVCLLGTGIEDVRSESTTVIFIELGEDEIQGYIADGEPMDKAGAYAIQGIASRWIPRIEGDYGNVVGLPVALVCRMMSEHNAR